MNEERGAPVVLQLTAGQCQSLIIEALTMRNVRVLHTSGFTVRTDTMTVKGMDVTIGSSIQLPED